MEDRRLSPVLCVLWVSHPDLRVRIHPAMTASWTVWPKISCRCRMPWQAILLHQVKIRHRPRTCSLVSLPGSRKLLLPCNTATTGHCHPIRQHSCVLHSSSPPILWNRIFRHRWVPTVCTPAYRHPHLPEMPVFSVSSAYWHLWRTATLAMTCLFHLYIPVPRPLSVVLQNDFPLPPIADSRWGWRQHGRGHQEGSGWCWCPESWRSSRTAVLRRCLWWSRISVHCLWPQRLPVRCWGRNQDRWTYTAARLRSFSSVRCPCVWQWWWILPYWIVLYLSVFSATTLRSGSAVPSYRLARCGNCWVL